MCVKRELHTMAASTSKTTTSAVVYDTEDITDRSTSSGGFTETLQRQLDRTDLDDESYEMEYESSFNLNIRKNLFYRILKKYEDNNIPVKISTIYYYNSGERCAAQKFQQKKIIKVLNILRIFNYNKKMYFIPLRRKQSRETLAQRPMNPKPNAVIIRRTLIETMLKGKKSSFPMRICLEKYANEFGGGNYCITGEIEYSFDVYNFYASVNVVENLLLHNLCKICSEILDLIDIELMFNRIEMPSTLKISSRTFNKIYEKLSGQNALVKYKFDGYKGRMVSNGTKLLYFDDMDNMIELDEDVHKNYVANDTYKRFYFPPNIIFQYEIMPENLKHPSYRSIILTDVLGAMYNTQMYHTEPKDVIEYFNFLNAEYNINKLPLPESIYLNLPMASVPYRLMTQFSIPLSDFFDPKKNNLPVDIIDSYLTNKFLHDNACDEKIDGYIIISGNREYKYKIPTIDARLIEVNSNKICEPNFKQSAQDRKKKNKSNNSKIRVFAIENQEYIYVSNMSDSLKLGQIYELAVSTSKTATIKDNYNINYACYYVDNQPRDLVCEVVRERFDRTVTSTIQELKDFIKTYAFFKKLFSKLKINKNN